MGSYDNASMDDEPFCSLVTEQNLSSEFSVQSLSEHPSCLEMGYELFESNVDPTIALDMCLDLSGVEDTRCVDSSEFTMGATVNKDVLVGESQNAGVLIMEKVSGSECGISGASFNEDRSYTDLCTLETGALYLEKGGSRGEDGCEALLESICMTGLPRNSVQQDEKNDDKSINGFSVEGVVEVVEQRSDAVASLETDSCDQISSLQGCEIPSELIPVTVLTSNCTRQNEQEDVKSICGPSLEVVDGKSDASAGIEADICYQISPLQDDEMLSKLLHTGDLASFSDWQSDQKDENSISGLSAERFTEVVETKSDTDICLQVLPSQGFQRALENPQMADSLSICAQQNEQRDDKSVDCPYVESIAKVVEEKSDVSADIDVEVCAPILPIEQNACNLNEGSFEVAQPVVVVNIGSSTDMADLLGKDVIISINSSSVVECSGYTDNEGNDNVRVDCVSETKCSDIVSSSSRRNGRRSKSSRKAQTKRAARKCGNTTNVLHPDGDINIIFKAVRRKRSCFSKAARSSIWGLFGNIMQCFEQCNDLVGVHQVQNGGSGKARSGRGSGKQNKNRASGSIRGSRRNRFASTTRVRLKVKVGKELDHSCLNNMVTEVTNISTSANAIISDYGTESYSGTNLEFPKLANGIEDKWGEEVSKHPERAKTYADASVLDGQLASKDVESTVMIDKTGGDAAGNYLVVPSHVVVEELGGSIENGCIDPGTSPDSEVINLVPDVQVDARRQDDLHGAVYTSSKDVPTPGDTTVSKRGKKKDKLHRAGNCSLEDGSLGPVSINKAKPSKKHGCRQNTGDGFCSSETFTSSTSANASSNSSSNKELSMEPLCFSRENELGVFEEALKVESGAEAKTYCKLDDGIGFSESHNSKNFQLSAKTMVHKLPKSPKSGRGSKGSSNASDITSRRRNGHRQGEKQRKSVNKCNVKEKGVCDQVVCKVESHPETGNDVDGIGKSNIGDNIAVIDESNLDMVAGTLGEQHLPPRKAWVLCDDCHKWRRIPAVLADDIENTNCTWACKDNMDKAFADCSIPQEKSNAEINAELDISDASGEEDACDAHLNYKELECRRSTVPQESAFKCISTNEFLHRRRRTQTIDEIMVCHCKQSPEGRLGCGDECLNRMLNIECVQGTCPCADHCSNQQFQKRKYAKLEWFRCGKKGYGLQLLDDISKGQFLIEYVGEVLDMHAYEARQKDYALKGHRHFYFMTLNGSEVIDACAKGNLGRFINHSCDPNCRTEKWMVNGEICIGLFALRDIRKGEEVTFDYNYVRVFGAAAKKCYCGAPQCRGYIGGDPLNAEVIVQGESDDEFPEPVMLLGNGKTGESILKDRHKIDKARTTVRQVEITTEKEDSVNRFAALQLHNSLDLEDPKGKLQSSVLPVEVSQQTEDVTSKPMSAVQQETSIEEETLKISLCSVERLEISSPSMTLSKSLSNGIDAFRKPKSDTVEHKWGSSKSHPLTKVSRSHSSVKKEKVKSNSLNANKDQMTANKSQALSIKPKKIIEGSSNGRFEAVEEKLNELLDSDGGISKRKDAPKGYLKLLLLTAASGDSGNGEAIQSNRDLSMIIDALLKTKSRVVLMDIINKNGLRMLHNTMKQYRRDFKKIPILRKLLKVLEYLAVREILTSEHINGGPPCPGMESFRESILSLTEHEDKQVHQIARNFRDRWIPRPVRKVYLDRDDGRMEIHRGSNCNRFSASHNYWRDQDTRPTEAIDCTKQSVVTTTSVDTVNQEGCSAPCIGGCPTIGTKPRKRKSRWDQPAETKTDSRSLEQLESSPLSRGGVVALDHKDKVSRENRNCTGCFQNQCQQDEAIIADNGKQNIPEDVPPGFSSPLNPVGSSNDLSTAANLPRQNVCHSKCPSDAVIGHPQEKFISRLPVSYGIPLSIVQQFGTPQEETVASWFIAPGMPFHPFPPLPPFPRDNKDHSPTYGVNPLTINQLAEEGQRDNHGPAPCYSDETTTSTTAANCPDVDMTCANNQQTFKRVRESSHDLGKKYFRQQKWNNPKLRPPPWLRKRNGCGHMGNGMGADTWETT